ncbi:NAD-dependent epimerase/dehydratase family protein [Dactylosporangium sp. McL0621]|uniref:NAD-dependent epimerase/dehydratase family protein n=1 Tax=Dactylosporangium sp. McL0621 TaxID=3415678 RepID=UPI003CF46DEA
MRWLVTGGAGYIGAHVVGALQGADIECIVVDDLSTGRAARVPFGVPLLRADVRDTAAVREIFLGHRPDGVIHLAARKDVAESAAHPLRYYRDIADAHVRAALALHEDELRDEVLSVGRGEGASVLQMIAAVGRALGRPLPYDEAPAASATPPSSPAPPESAPASAGAPATTCTASSPPPSPKS